MAVWSVAAREGVRCLGLCRVTCDCDDDGEGQELRVTRHASHVVRGGGFAAVAAGAGGGISVIVTVDAAAKQLLVSACLCC